MRIAVVMLCALCSASMYAQARAAAAPPRPPATETVAPAIPGVVAAGTKVAIVKDGFQSSEGPILMPDGTTLFTEPGASKVHKIDKSGTISTFVENTGTRERPRARFEGTTHRDDGADTSRCCIRRLPRRCSPRCRRGRTTSSSTRRTASISRCRATSLPRSITFLPAARRPSWPKLRARTAFSCRPDEKTLYSADSGGEYLIAFDVQPDGKLTNRRNFGKYQGLKSAESHADGIAVDSEGRVYVGIEPGVQVFSPKGEALGLIPTSQRPQNLAFAGPDKKTLYLTGGSALFSVKMLAQGYARPRANRSRCPPAEHVPGASRHMIVRFGGDDDWNNCKTAA